MDNKEETLHLMAFQDESLNLQEFADGRITRFDSLADYCHSDHFGSGVTTGREIEEEEK